MRIIGSIFATMLAALQPEVAAAQVRIIAEPPARIRDYLKDVLTGPAENGATHEVVRSPGALPERDEIKASFLSSFAKARSGHDEAVKPVAFSGPFVERGCTILDSAPAGVELVEGGMNGVATIVECGKSILVLYQFDYSRPMTQNITIVDREYASNPELHRFRIKRGKILYDNGVVGNVRWLNPMAEAKVEIYDLGVESGWAGIAVEAIDTFAHDTLRR